MRKQLTEYEKGYIEGVIDTDGSLSLYKRKASYERGWRPQVEMSVSNNSRAVLNKIQDILGTDLKIVKKPSGNLQLKWVTNVLKWLLPQIKLVVKEERRKVIIDYLKLADKKGHYWEGYEEELEGLFERWDAIDRDENTSCDIDIVSEGEKKLTDYERGFIEAVVDMDGCLSISKNKSDAKRGWTPRIWLRIDNNSIKLLNKIQRILGINRKLNRKRKCHYIKFGANVLRWLLPQLDLVVKKGRQDAVMDYLDFIDNNYTFQYSEMGTEYENDLRNLFRKMKEG